MPEKFKGKKTEKAGAVVEEEVLLSCIDVCDSYMQVDIQEAYHFATIDDYRFENVTDEDDRRRTGRYNKTMVGIRWLIPADAAIWNIAILFT